MLPVQVVERDLHELYLGVLAQNALQHLGAVVERDADVPYPAFRLPLVYIIKHVTLRDHPVVASGIHIVQQVAVKVPGAGPGQTFVENRLYLALVGDYEGRQLVSQKIALACITPGQALPDGVLACAVVVDITRVKVVVPVLHEDVRHPADLGYVDVLRIAVGRGQAHQAETQLFCYVCHVFGLLGFVYANCNADAVDRELPDWI